jgi:hypothetical protein
VISWHLFKPRNVIVIVAFVVVARFALASAFSALDGRNAATAA